MRALSLIVVLSGFWLVASGQFTPQLLGFLLASVALVVLLAHRLGVLDAEGHPTHLLGRALRFWPWLIGRIVTSNLAVVRVVLGPRARLAPRLLRVPITPRDGLGRAIIANSATLTPGTVACDLDGGEMIVHCLTAEAAAELQGGELDRAVVRFVGGGR